MHKHKSIKSNAMTWTLNIEHDQTANSSNILIYAIVYSLHIYLFFSSLCRNFFRELFFSFYLFVFVRSFQCEKNDVELSHPVECALMWNHKKQKTPYKSHNWFVLYVWLRSPLCPQNILPTPDYQKWWNSFFVIVQLCMMWASWKSFSAWSSTSTIISLGHKDTSAGFKFIATCHCNPWC